MLVSNVDQFLIFLRLNHCKQSIIQHISHLKIRTRFSEIGAQIWEKLIRDQNTIFIAGKMKADHCYHDASHQICNSYMVLD